MQYTVRNVPAELDERLRAISAEENRSLNEVVLRLLRAAVGLGEERPQMRDLGDVAGTWIEDPMADQALAQQRTIDEELWR
jgi:plasmid stability protein